jgi:protein-S-isoprenylcysteine O-methyltransferase Ste14
MSSASAKAPSHTERFYMRVLVQTSFFLLIQVACLFGPAGTFRWPMAWVYLVVQEGFVVAGIAVLDPGLIRDRMAREPGAKRWDPPLAATGYLLFCPITLLAAGLELKHRGFESVVPIAIQIGALAVLVAGYGFAFWAMAVNRFFVKFVRIQKERGHHVVTTGPYAYVRHPGYAGAILAHLALPIALGSLWAVVPATIGCTLFAIRTWLEDRTLQGELPGYREYIGDVHYRLVPGIW